MSYDEKTLYSELRPFADMVIDQGRGVTVSDLAFASAEDRYSTAFIPLSTLALPANSTVKFMQKNVGESGQGTTAALTIAETNNTNGDRQPSNQVYIATHLGFQVYATPSAASLAPIAIQSHQTMYSIASNTTWALTVGDGIKRTLGTVMEYPAGSGVGGFSAVSRSSANALVESWANNGCADPAHKRKLPIPIVFPPNIQVDLELKTGSAVTLQDNLGLTTSGALGGRTFSGGTIAYKATFKGFRMTMPA